MFLSCHGLFFYYQKSNWVIEKCCWAVVIYASWELKHIMASRMWMG